MGKKAVLILQKTPERHMKQQKKSFMDENDKIVDFLNEMYCA